MSKEMQTAQTTEFHSEVGENAVANQQPQEVNEVAFVDGPRQDTAKEVVQTRAQNSENARRRREAQRQSELKEAQTMAREQAIMEALDGVNPYTGEAMKDSADVREFLTMKEIEKQGGDPLSDFSKFHKQKEREKEEQVTKAQEEKEWYRKDQADFTSKHPEVDLTALIENVPFQKFANGKVGLMPLSDIYDEFIDLISEYDKKAKHMAKQMFANQKASPGSLASSTYAEGAFYTKEQVQKMTAQEVHANYDRIRASMRNWK